MVKELIRQASSEFSEKDATYLPSFLSLQKAVIVSLLSEKMHIVQVRDALKRTQCRPSLRCWQSTLHLLPCQLEVVGVAGTNACHNKFLYSLFKLQCLSTYPAKLTDSDGISCSILPRKNYKLNIIHWEVTIKSQKSFLNENKRM